jgi:small redox-active disulfide protein 2
MGKITQIIIAGASVGLTGLDEAVRAVDREVIEDEETIADMLIDLISKRNYVPESSRSEYRRALLIEYKKRKGQYVETDTGRRAEILVLGPGCANCDRLMKEMRAVLAELDLTANLTHVKDLAAIAGYGPVATPGLVMNGKIVSQGRVPNRARLIQLLKETIE